MRLPDSGDSLAVRGIAGGDSAEASSDSSVWDHLTMAAAGRGGGGGERVDAKHNSYKAPGLRGAILEAAHVSCLEDRYALGPQLGWGQFGVIRSCSDLITGEDLACKSIAKDRLVSPDYVRGVKLEIEVMARLAGHPNVVDLRAVYEDDEFVHLVMELCAGGELFHRLEQRGFFSEHEAAVLFRYLMEVVTLCHSKGIVHRDLKPENILLVSKSPSSPIKLADFGLATYIKSGTPEIWLLFIDSMEHTLRQCCWSLRAKSEIWSCQVEA